MEKNKILDADILDIIFDGKNKKYGAYELRKTYNNRLVRAVFFTIVLVLFAFLGTVYSGMGGKKSGDGIDFIDTRLGDIKKIDPPPPPPIIKTPPPPKPNQVKFTKPVIVKNELKDDEKIPEIHEDQLISTKTVEGEDKNLVIQAPVEDKESRIVEAPKVSEEDKVFISVQHEAQFPGGQQAWVRYLQKNLDPNAPVENGAPPGTYQVIVKFIVSKDGSISDVNAETKYGFGMEEEAVKIIRRGPKWIPALQNDQNVKAYRRQPITFVVTE